MRKIGETTTSPFDPLLQWTLLPLIPRWVKPNQVTVLRFFLITPTALLVLTQHYTAAILLFMLSVLTDAVDGAMARTRDQITEWGELFDPIADKLLIGVIGFLLITQFLQWWLIAIIVVLESVTIIAAMVVKLGRPSAKIHANVFGKTKMILQSSGIILLFILAQVPQVDILSNITTAIFSISIIFTILSMYFAGI